MLLVSWSTQLTDSVCNGVNMRVTPPVGTECRWTVIPPLRPSARTSSTTTTHTCM
ncbi:Hypothetical protein SMAX5B_010638 [Scophthalmus maximus]|uniref:Uncharacterized protein n=1 Tax=Scophthalmus maximus TaxID=52904 RepID=A0A2U9B2W3_SCOMX|nr:Hypothetical protein SMAX5B_010638 [Scophthalmus maximus]